jgi:nucleoside 2-deoxyribosyltransferase
MDSKTQLLINLATILTKNDRPVIYLAGKVSGLPGAEVRAKFDKAKAYLEAEGFKVLSPIDFMPHDTPWQPAMRMATIILNLADHVYFLKDWEDSPGALFEFEVAVRFGLNCIYQ